MVKLDSERGYIRIENDVFTNLAGAAATNCFGVKGMAMRSMSDGLVHLLKREAMGKGVRIMYFEDGGISIELHIIVDHGVNITAICRSIISEVKYRVAKETGVEVRGVNVCVDSIMVD